MDVTVGEILQKLKTKIFNENELSVYREREETLKKFINIIFNHSVQIIELSVKENSKITFYKDLRIKRSLRRFSDYTAYLTNELDREKIINFCTKQRLFISSNYDIDTSFIVANSYYTSIKYDLYWMTDLKYIDVLDISVNKFKIENLSSYLPQTFSNFESKVLPFFKKDELFSEFKSTLKEIKQTHNAKLYRACNLLILTSIEGIVRKLGEFLIEKQNLDISDKSEYNSLDNFLRKIPWKEDFKIHKNTYDMISGDLDFVKNSNPLEEIEITFKDRLDFLRRRFKDDRDLILHGLENDYGKEWHLFINFKALENVYTTAKYYRDKYK